MAPLNPTPQPVQDPNYIYWSREIQQPEPNRAGQFAWTGAGEALEIGAKGADLAIKQGIASGMEKDLRPIEEQETNRLQGFYDQLTGQNNPAGVGSSKLDNSVSGGIGGAGGSVNLTNAPPDLKKLPDQLDALDSRKANGNISNTHYIGELYKIAKDYRDRFDSPGYHEFIDEQFHRITGIRPANAQIQSLMSDINSFQSKKDELRNKVMTELGSGEFIGGAAEAQRLASGQHTVYDSLQFIENRKAPAAAYRRELAHIEFEAGNDKLFAERLAQPALTRANSLAMENIDNIVLQSGMKLRDVLASQGTSKPIDLRDEQWGQMHTMVKANMDATEAAIRSELNQPAGNSGRTVAAVLGPAKVDEIVANATHLHRSWLDTIGNKETGLMFSHLHHAQAVVNSGTADLVTDPNIKDPRVASIVLNTAHMFGGPNAPAWFQGTEDFQNAASKGISKLLSDTTNLSISQLSPDLRPTTGAHNPPTYTFTQNIQTIKKNTEGSPIQQATGARIIADNQSRFFLDPNMGDDAKVQRARYLFGDPKALFNLNESHINPDGRVVKGRDEYFAQWASPAISATMKRLNERDPGVWPLYKNWVEQTGVRLYREDIGNLNEMMNQPGIGLKYDTENHRLEAYDIPGASKGNAPLAGSTKPANTYQPQLDRGVNSMFQVWADIAKNSGEDPNAYILKTLQQRGVDLKKISPKVANAITNAHMQFQEEDQDQDRGSLKNFLADPGQAAKPRGQTLNPTDYIQEGPPVNSPPLPLNELIRRQRTGAGMQ